MNVLKFRIFSYYFQRLIGTLFGTSCGFSLPENHLTFCIYWIKLKYLKLSLLICYFS